MPFVNIKIAGSTLTQEQVQRLQQGATELMADVLRKKSELTAVLVEQAAFAAWAVGGNEVAAAAHLDMKVTEGTNTTEEKSRFIGGAMEMFRSVLGKDLCPVAYVVVHEIPKDAWGWDGLTQAHRAKDKAA